MVKKKVAFILLCEGQESLIGFKWEMAMIRQDLIPFILAPHSTETAPLKANSDLHFAKSTGHFSSFF